MREHRIQETSETDLTGRKETNRTIFRSNLQWSGPCEKDFRVGSFSNTREETLPSQGPTGRHPVVVCLATDTRTKVDYVCVNKQFYLP